MNEIKTGAKKRSAALLLTLCICWGCGGDVDPEQSSSTPAQAPGVEGMKWLKEHGYVDEKGRPIDRKKPNDNR